MPQPQVHYLPVERLVPTPWNPNAMSPKAFKRLVKSIEEDGFTEPVLVVLMDADLRAKYLASDQLAAGGDYWLIVSGHHRVEAAKLLCLDRVAAVVKDGWTEDDVKLKNVKMNVLRGKMDPEKFTRLYLDVAATRGEELAREQMGIVEERELKRLLREVKENLPPAQKAQLEEREDEIRTTDDLSRILTELFEKNGDQLDTGFMVFDFGGRTHYWIPLDRATKESMDRLARRCYEGRKDLNRVFTTLLLGGTTLEQALDAAPKLDEELVGW